MPVKYSPGKVTKIEIFSPDPEAIDMIAKFFEEQFEGLFSSSEFTWFAGPQKKQSRAKHYRVYGPNEE